MSLKIIKATYFDPDRGSESGTDVTRELSAQIRNGQLLYQGVYNKIFRDEFKGIHKRLEVEVEFKGKIYTKFYNEDDKIDLPHDLGIDMQKWWERTWVQLIMLLGALAGIAGLATFFR